MQLQIPQNVGYVAPFRIQGFQFSWGAFFISLTLRGVVWGTATLFKNKRFALNEMFERNASKFAIFYV